MSDDNDGVTPKMTFSFGDETKPFNGWVQLVKEEKVPTEAPWRKGTLIKINNSPAPSRIPDDSVVMFLDHALTKYRISTPEKVIDSGNEESPVEISHESKETDHLQHRITVLFDEKIVELYSNQIEYFDEIDSKKEI